MGCTPKSNSNMSCLKGEASVDNLQIHLWASGNPSTLSNFSTENIDPNLNFCAYANSSEMKIRHLTIPTGTCKLACSTAQHLAIKYLPNHFSESWSNQCFNGCIDLVSEMLLPKKWTVDYLVK